MDAMTPPDMLQPEQPPVAQLPAVLPMTHDVTISTTRKSAQARCLGVPPEEFGIERGARDIKTCNYCYHEIVTKTEGDLIAEGYDKEQVLTLETYTGATDSETLDRDSVDEHSGATGSLNTASRLVRITEHYVRMDYEGTGNPCLYQVMTGGEQAEILRKGGKDCIEPFDAIPFAATTPIPIPHRFIGRSIADLVMPLQREKTAMKRGALDNLYLQNNPRVEVPEASCGENTLDDLLVSRPGGIVRTKTGGGIQWQKVPDVTGSIYPMMQYLDAELEARTGIGRQAQGIDANALQNQSATAVAQVFSASQMRIKLVARVMAEGIRDIFALLHGTIRKHGQQQETVRLRNAWVTVNPRQWKTRQDMTIIVGLGSGSKAQQFAQTMAIANVQEKLATAGKSNMVSDRELYNTAAELTRIMGHKNPDAFFKDPMAKGPDGQPANPAPPPPVDPKLEQIRLQAQTDMAEMQERAKLHLMQAQAEIDLQRMKAQAEIDLAKQRADVDAKLALLQFGLDERDHERKAAQKAQAMAHDQQAHDHVMAEREMNMLTDAIARNEHMDGQSTNPPQGDE